MNDHPFSSSLAGPIAQLIRLRRLSGTDYASQARLLESFDRFLVQRGFTQTRLTRQIFEDYLQSLAHLSPRSRGNRFSVVRQLCRYLAQTDPLGYIPEPLPTPSSFSAHAPYIFDPNQIRALLAAASALPPPTSLRPHTYRTLLGLLYSTGVRIGEALALSLQHFFPDQQRLLIAQGKFRKARWIPLSHSTCRALQGYLQLRMDRTPHRPEDSLLLNERSRRLSYPTVNHVFKDLLTQAGIARDPRKGPRLHHLRHTFAVHRLLAWYRDGQDVQARLPALATYMGHVELASTRVYLRPTAELLAQVQRRFHRHFRQHLSLPGDLS